MEQYIGKLFSWWESYVGMFGGNGDDILLHVDKTHCYLLPYIYNGNIIKDDNRMGFSHNIRKMTINNFKKALDKKDYVPFGNSGYLYANKNKGAELSYDIEELKSKYLKLK